MNYLLFMSIVAAVNMLGIIFMGYTTIASDREWLVIILIMTVQIFVGAVALGWGIISIADEYGACSLDSPRTFLYTFAFTLLYSTSLVLTSITVFVRILPSLVVQAYLRSRLI